MHQGCLHSDNSWFQKKFRAMIRPTPGKLVFTGILLLAILLGLISRVVTTCYDQCSENNSQSVSYKVGNLLTLTLILQKALVEIVPSNEKRIMISYSAPIFGKPLKELNPDEKSFTLEQPPIKVAPCTPHVKIEIPFDNLMENFYIELKEGRLLVDDIIMSKLKEFTVKGDNLLISMRQSEISNVNLETRSGIISLVGITPPPESSSNNHSIHINSQKGSIFVEVPDETKEVVAHSDEGTVFLRANPRTFTGNVMLNSEKSDCSVLRPEGGKIKYSEKKTNSLVASIKPRKKYQRMKSRNRIKKRIQMSSKIAPVTLELGRFGKQPKIFTSGSLGEL
eukprot:TRINITY_DN1457_c0_g1_i1.p1 TRINITY_DN1457_c0_g1~~TRINITY_DN1457_c0_g1_i1.p1  ORF type:complete len:337 (-),score=74.46 TRINITY_DN1457_c0_g1_i1:93-1103(-)